MRHVPPQTDVVLYKHISMNLNDTLRNKDILFVYLFAHTTEARSSVVWAGAHLDHIQNSKWLEIVDIHLENIQAYIQYYCFIQYI